MTSMSRYRRQGFTLVELMVVIAIIILLAGMSIPAMSDFMRSRRLSNAGNQIQASCMRARSRAIAQRERQYLIFFVNGNTYSISGGPTNETGKPNSIHAFDSNENISGGVLGKVEEDPIMYLPELTTLVNPSGANNFGFTFRVDGTIQFHAISDQAIDPDEGNGTDMQVTQAGSTMQCYVDIMANTGRVRFIVRE